MGRTESSRFPMWAGKCLTDSDGNECVSPVNYDAPVDYESLEKIHQELKELRLRLKIAQEKTAQIVTENVANRALHGFSRARINLINECNKREFCVKPDIWFMRMFDLLKSVINLIIDDSDVYDIMFNYGRSSSSSVFRQLQIDDLIHSDSTFETSQIANSSMWFSYASQFHTKDIYCGDFGVNRIADGHYERQEDLAVDGIYAEILFGMLMLREGGSMIIKTYTYFTEKMQCVIGMLFNHFDVQFTKGQFSKATNSERYVVCMNYHTPLTYSQAMDLLVRVPNTPLPLHNVLTIEKTYVEVQIKALCVAGQILTCYKQNKLDATKRAEFLARCL